MTKWPEPAAIINAYAIEIHAGALIDRGKLEAAILAPIGTFGGADLYPTIAEKVAQLGYGVCQAHAYQDGNKRLAWLCMCTAMQINRIDICVEETEAARVIFAIANGSCTRDGLLYWLNDWMILGRDTE